MSRTREIWKVGGSVLTGPRSFEQVAERIREHLAIRPDIDRLYVVVSAVKGRTDRLIREIDSEVGAAGSLATKAASESRPEPGTDSAYVALRLLQGEIESALHLRESLARARVWSRMVTQLDCDFPIVASGGYLSAQVETAASRRRFADFDRGCRGLRVIVVAGYGAVNAQGEPVLLGRNASDYVAAFLSALDPRVRTVHFVKDVDGLYDGYGTAAARRVDDIGIEDLRGRDTGRLLDRRVLDTIRCDFRIGALGASGSGTTVRVVSRGLRKEGA